MKKIIIEQIGNIIMVTLCTWMLVSMVTNSYWRANGNSKFQVGVSGILFLAWLVIFGIVKIILSKTDRSYNYDSGELSTADEREKTISEHAIRWTYKVLFTLLLIDLITVPVTGVIIDSDITLFKQVVVIDLGGTLIVGFITYLTGWIRFDMKE